MLLCYAPSEFATALLSHGKGVAFHIQPSTGTLKAFQHLIVEITAYNNMWGEYRDDLVCKVGGASVLSEELLWHILHQLYFPDSFLLKILFQLVGTCVKIRVYISLPLPSIRDKCFLLQSVA